MKELEAVLPAHFKEASFESAPAVSTAAAKETYVSPAPGMGSRASSSSASLENFEARKTIVLSEMRRDLEAQRQIKRGDRKMLLRGADEALRRLGKEPF